MSNIFLTFVADLYCLEKNIVKGEKINLDIDNVIEFLGTGPHDINEFVMICMIWGRHEPCFTFSLSHLLTGKIIIKMNDGKNAYIYCKEDEIDKITSEINKNFSRYGYHARAIKNGVRVALSEFSTCAILAKMEYVPIYCKENNGTEKIIAGIKKKTATPRILEEFKRQCKEFKKIHPGIICKYPSHIKNIGEKGKKEKIYLPINSGYLGIAFISMLIKERFTKQQTKTISSLYELTHVLKARFEIHDTKDYNKFVKNQIINIISIHAGISKDTVRKHVFVDKDSSLEKILQRYKLLEINEIHHPRDITLGNAIKQHKDAIRDHFESKDKNT